CTATPLKLVNVSKHVPLFEQDEWVVPLRTPPTPVPAAPAWTVSEPPRNASVSFVTLATPTPAATPTKPPAIDPATSTRPVPSEAETRTVPPASSVTPVPVFAYVVELMTVTDTDPATPTRPPPAPAATETSDSCPCVVISIEFSAR